MLLPLSLNTMPRQYIWISILLTTGFFTGKAEECSLCPNINDTISEFAVIKFNDQLTANCSYADQLAREGYFSNCTAIHESFIPIACGCSDLEYSCRLCGEGNELPLPNRKVAGRTCAEWEYEANTEFEQGDCSSWQKSMGAYCGCDISAPGFFDGVCRICNNTLLPNPNQTVTFTNGRVAYCASVEQDLNTLETVDAGIQCEDQQQKYKKACKCDAGIQFPANPPTPVLSDANRRQTHNKIQVAFMGILTVLTFEALFI